MKTEAQIIEQLHKMEKIQNGWDNSAWAYCKALEWVLGKRDMENKD